jgi:transketolase C-terminal domain/subunit
MKYKKKQINNIKKWNKIITLEDHLVDGGFGSWLKESYKGKKTEIEIKGLSSQVIGKVGKEQFLLSKFFNKL